METEFEVKILDINVADVNKKLEQISATKICERNMKRLVYDVGPKETHRWVRLRDDGEKITLAVKEIQTKEIDGTKEVEIIVDDFEKARMVLSKIGLATKAYQENRRISYVLNAVNIEIDFWPGIPPYLEIEGRSIKDVQRVVRLMGFDKSQITTMDTYEIYEHYGQNLRDVKDLRF